MIDDIDDPEDAIPCIDCGRCECVCEQIAEGDDDMEDRA